MGEEGRESRREEQKERREKEHWKWQAIHVPVKLPGLWWFTCNTAIAAIVPKRKADDPRDLPTQQHPDHMAL